MLRVRGHTAMTPKPQRIPESVLLMLRSELAEFLERAREARPFGIGQIQLVPTRDATAGCTPEEKLHANAQAFEESAAADHELGNHATSAADFGTEFLEAAGRSIVPSEDLPAEEPIESHLSWLCAIRRFIRCGVRHRYDPGIAATHLRSRCSRAAATVSPAARSTFIRSRVSRMSPNGIRRGRPSAIPNACSTPAIHLPKIGATR